MIPHRSRLEIRDHVHLICFRRAALPHARVQAFTLIELIAVLALMAILATLAAISLRRSDSIARVAADIATFDQLARAHARQTGAPVRLEIDLRRGMFTRPGGMTLKIPEGYQLRSIRRPDALTTLGTAHLDVSIRGQSQTYALLLSGPRDQRVWLLFPGLTSSSMTTKEDREIERLFSTISTRNNPG